VRSVVWYRGVVVPGATESVTAIRDLIRVARARGVALDEGPTARAPAFSARIAVTRAHALWECAVRTLGPGLPLEVAAAADHRPDLLDFAALSCRTIGEALDLAVAHWRYVSEAFAVVAVRHGGTVHLGLTAPAPLPLGARLAIEHRLAALVRAGRELAGSAWQTVEVVLGHHPPVALAVWQRACGAPVRIAELPGLVIAEDALARPVCAPLSRAAGQLARELLDWYTPALAPPSVPAPALADRVAAALARDLGGAAPTLEQVAVELGLSARSLHRQLAAEGTSYQRVRDGLRCDEAIRQAIDRRRPFKAIAAAVGFADPRAFRRAFKRWTGITPQQFRRGVGRAGAG